MRYSMFIAENKGHELQGVVDDCFADSGLEQPGIIGIVYPRWLGVIEEREFHNWLISDFTADAPHHVVIPVPDTDWFDMDVPEQVTALAGRVARDRIDGVRYNRLFIALYHEDNAPPESVIVEHDHFFKVYTEKDGRTRFGAVYAMGEKK
jgi:hypothetical protein